MLRKKVSGLGASKMASKFIEALRARYKTPREVLARLGLDQDVLESEMAKPTRLEAIALINTAKAVNPLLNSRE